MSSGHIVKRGAKPHYCKKPINWFNFRFKTGTIWKCDCGLEYKYTAFGRGLDGESMGIWKAI